MVRKEKDIKKAIESHSLEINLTILNVLSKHIADNKALISELPGIVQLFEGRSVAITRKQLLKFRYFVGTLSPS